MRIRNGNVQDLDELDRIEKICFPPAEAAPRDTIRKRLEKYPDSFKVLECNDKIVGFIAGLATDENVISDEMFDNVELHKEDGAWKLILGLDVLPEHQGLGYGKILMNAFVDSARKENRKGCGLTCKEHLVSYYEKMGYKSFGLSKSTYGGAVWYDMRIEF